MNSISALEALSPETLTARLDHLAANERCALVEFLRHLAELDRRKLYLALGYASLYDYCRDHLHLSDGSAFRRYTAARLLARFPAIEQHLASGSLSLKRVTMLRSVLTPENHVELLQRAVAGTELDVQALAASFAPKPEVKDSIRRMPVPVQRVAMSELPITPAPDVAPDSVTPELLVAPSLAVAVTPLPEVAGAASPGRPRMEITATSGDRFGVKMSVGREFIAKFDELKSALSHVVPDGNFEEVLLEAFDLALEVCARRKSAQTKKPPKEQPAAEPSSTTRHIPAAVRRAVSERDGNRCAFIGTKGKRCSSAHQLEFHHEDPFALGGAATIANISLRCRAHNHYEAILDFGEAHMTRMRDKRRARSLPPVEVTPPGGASVTSTGGSSDAPGLH